MIAGIVLTDSEEKESYLAFLGDELETFSIKDTEKIVQKIRKEDPEVVAIDSGTELSGKKMTKKEAELQDEGYSFTPSSMEKKKVERTRAIERSVQHFMDKPPEFIRFDPVISSEELALDSDAALESLGIDPSSIDSAREFDAAIGAVTARFYSQNQYDDLGVIVPKSIQ